MGVEIQWDNDEKTIMHFIYEGRWTWKEFYTKIDEANQLMDTVPHPCVSIIDMQKSRYLPSGAALHISNVIRQSMSHNNSGISVFLQADMIVQIMIDVLKEIYPDILENTEWLYANTLEEARKMAQEQVDKLHASAED
ncbi:MAG: hypothetical protein Phog2KO_14110 [Phototrophicaceae bacterium]